MFMFGDRLGIGSGVWNDGACCKRVVCILRFYSKYTQSVAHLFSLSLRAIPVVTANRGFEFTVNVLCPDISLEIGGLAQSDWNPFAHQGFLRKVLKPHQNTFINLLREKRSDKRDFGAITILG